MIIISPDIADDTIIIILPDITDDTIIIILHDITDDTRIIIFPHTRGLKSYIIPRHKFAVTNI